jgi:hypothetical protein
MTHYQTEAKPQSWRAVAVFDDGRYDQLLYLHRSSAQIRGGYRQAFFEVLDEEERSHVKAIAMEHWQGAADAGRWEHHTNLTVPNPVMNEKLAAVA